MDHNPTISFLENCDCIKQLWWEEVKTFINFDHLPHFEHIVHDTTFTIYGECTPGKLSYNMFYLEPWYMWLDQLFELDPIVGLYERWRALLYDWKASVVVHFQMHWVIACMDTSLRKIAIIVLGVSNARVLMHSTLFSLLP